MKNYWCYLRIEGYKFWNSKLVMGHLLIPISGIVMMHSYYSLTNWTELEQVLAYLQVIAMAYPFVISIVMTLLYEQEADTRFQFLLTAPTNRVIPHLSKLTLILLLGLIATLIAIVGFGVMFIGIGFQSLSLDFYFKETMVMFLSHLPVYMLQYLVVFSLGRGGSFGIGLMGSLISALMITGIGDSSWFLLPWGYGIRMTTYLLQTEVMHSLSNFTQEQLSLALFSIVISISIGLIGLFMLARFFEGRQEQI